MGQRASRDDGFAHKLHARKTALYQHTLVRRRTSNQRSIADSAQVRERLCSQLSLLIQSGRVGIRTRVIVNCRLGRFTIRQTYRTPYIFDSLISTAASGKCSQPKPSRENQKSILASGRTPDSVSLRHLSQHPRVLVPYTLRCRNVTLLRQDSLHRFNPLRPVHLPCSRLDVHPATAIADNAGGLLPHRFAPVPFLAARVGLFSVAVVVICRSRSKHPNLLFR
jgi:hypothetical protein